MKSKITAVLCEGPHDVFFLSKLLKSINFKKCEEIKLKDFPQPMDQFLISEAQKSNVQDVNLTEVRQALLPHTVLKKIDSDVYFFLYALGGDSRSDLRNRILTTFVDATPKPGELTEIFNDSSLSVAYFLDADDMGIPTRIDELNKELKAIFGDIEPIDENGKVIEHHGIGIGGYIFAEEGKETGRLENIIIPMMRIDNEVIFDNATIYIDSHFDKSRVKKGNFKKDKSIISVAGQLQRSGSSNNVVIDHSDYITKPKIDSHPRCQEIVDFFSKLI